MHAFTLVHIMERDPIGSNSWGSKELIIPTSKILSVKSLETMVVPTIKEIPEEILDRVSPSTFGKVGSSLTYLNESNAATKVTIWECPSCIYALLL